MTVATVANQTIIGEARGLARGLLNSDGNIESTYFERPKWGRMPLRMFTALTAIPLIGMSVPLYLTVSAAGACFGEYLIDSDIQTQTDIKLIELKHGNRKFIDHNSIDTVQAAFAKVFQENTYEELSKYICVQSRVKAAAAIGFALATWANFNRIDSHWHDYSTGTRDICCLTAGLAIAIPALLFGIYHARTEWAKLKKNNREGAEFIANIDKAMMDSSSSTELPATKLNKDCGSSIETSSK